MRRESLHYHRARARQECEAALNASSLEARRAHAELAAAYAQLVEIAELQQLGELPPGKLTSMSEELHQRDDTEYGGHMPKPIPGPVRKGRFSGPRRGPRYPV